jgi:hypothetical protein
LIVNPDNVASLAFHQKLGFQNDVPANSILVDGIPATRDYNGPGIHMVQFHRPLV